MKVEGLEAASPKGMKLIAVGKAHGIGFVICPDPVRVEVALAPSGSNKLRHPKPWALPTATNFHAFGVKQLNEQYASIV